MADPGHQSLDPFRRIEAHQFTGTAAQVISEQDELQLKSIVDYTQIFHLPYAKFNLFDFDFA